MNHKRHNLFEHRLLRKPNFMYLLVMNCKFPKPVCSNSEPKYQIPHWNLDIILYFPRKYEFDLQYKKIISGYELSLHENLCPDLNKL